MILFIIGFLIGVVITLFIIVTIIFIKTLILIKKCEKQSKDLEARAKALREKLQ